MLENYLNMIVEEITMSPEKLLKITPLLIFMVMGSMIDSKELRIPNRLNLAMFALRFLVLPLYPIETKHVLGCILGALFIMIPAIMIMKPMGGDIKFLAVIGFWMGDVATLITMIIASILFIVHEGLIKRRGRKESVAFGPFMSIGCTVVILIGVLLNFM